ncbi:unnamed protein product [Durusdinium trenchii]|uniref:Uncharacterized protein n=2 Tax=Durusdinium trenchii TaxID=1381693 RepID=A0ABP0LBL1_9DINO
MLPIILAVVESSVLLATLCCCYNRLVCLSCFAVLAAGLVASFDALRGSTWHLTSLTYDSAAITGHSSMRAAIYTLNGYNVGWETAEVPVPHHSDLSMLIRVKAVSVNPSNFKHPMIPAAWPFLRHLRQWPVGYDVSGVVLSVGKSSACDVKVGDDVWGMSIGVAGEYAVLPCHWTVPVPGRLTYGEAAGLGVAGLTSMQAYERNPIQPGQQVLVVGASGGCGQFGVSLAGAMGANVTGICGSRNTDFVKQLYSSVTVVDYKSQVDMDSLISIGQRFDMIYDTVSSNAPEDPNYEPVLRPTLKAHGTYVAIGPCPDFMDQLRAGADMFTRIFNVRVQRKGYDWFLLSPSKPLILRLNRFFESALNKVAIDSVHDLTQPGSIELALERQKSRRAVGKVILTFGDIPSRRAD